MAALRYDWEKIRAEYEAGATMGDLAKKYSMAKSGISFHAKREGWVQDVSGAVDRLTEAKLNGVLNTLNPQKKAEALDAAAEQKASVLRRHREEWAWHKDLLMKAADEDGFGERCKKAKIIAETLKISQEGERKAWGIADVEARAMEQNIERVVVRWAENDRRY